mgnify:CR=1 FL=1
MEEEEEEKGRNQYKHMDILRWLVVSSQNPEKISLTVKSAAPLILAVLAFFNLDAVEGDLDKLIAAVVGIVSGVTFIYGFVRKLVNSRK